MHAVAHRTNAFGVTVAGILLCAAMLTLGASARAAVHPRPARAAPGRHAVGPQATSVPMFDRPIDAAWPAANAWSPRLEDEYSAFVAQLGQAVAARRCRRLDECLRDPAANALYDAASDPRLTLGADCGDLPYLLRAYFSMKRHLPFGFVSDVMPMGPQIRRGHVDLRYALNLTPDAWRSWQQYATPREVFRAMRRLVHTGMYRTAPAVETGDFYPVAMSRAAVRAGTMFYDPNGHVLVVADVQPDGVVHLVDGHPDGSLTFKRFGQAFVPGSSRLGGGFKNFRAQSLRDGHIVRATNAEISLYDGAAQYDPTRYVTAGQVNTYHAWVRASLASAGSVVDPITEFRDQIRAVCRDVSDRVEAVSFAVTAGLPGRPHPDALPSNIYGTEGDWEMYSTPSRDARLKAAFRELRETVAGSAAARTQLDALRAAWTEESARAECRFTYTNSAGTAVAMTLETVLDRLFALSFDPYHCPELRWGAPAGSAELSTCHDDAGKLAWYRAENRLRNQIDREYGSPTPLDFGPEAPPVIDVRAYLSAQDRAVATVQ